MPGKNGLKTMNIDLSKFESLSRELEQRLKTCIRKEFRRLITLKIH